MIYEHSEFLSDSDNEYLYDSDGQQLFAHSDIYYIEDVVNITAFTLTPATTTINSKVAVSVKVDDSLEEKAY